MLKAQLDQQAQAADTIINNMRVMEGKLAGKPEALQLCCRWLDLGLSRVADYYQTVAAVVGVVC